MIMRLRVQILPGRVLFSAITGLIRSDWWRKRSLFINLATHSFFILARNLFTESLTDPRCPGSKVARFRKQEFRSWFDPGNWKSADLEELNPVETGELVLGCFVNLIPIHQLAYSGKLQCLRKMLAAGVGAQRTVFRLA